MSFIDKDISFFNDRNVRAGTPHAAVHDLALSRKVQSLAYNGSGTKFNYNFISRDQAPVSYITSSKTWSYFYVLGGSAPDISGTFGVPWRFTESFQRVCMHVVVMTGMSSMKLGMRIRTSTLVDAADPASAVGDPVLLKQEVGKSGLMEQNVRDTMSTSSIKSYFLHRGSMVVTPSLPSNRRTLIYPEIIYDTTSILDPLDIVHLGTYIKQFYVYDVPSTAADPTAAVG